MERAERERSERRHDGEVVGMSVITITREEKENGRKLYYRILNEVITNHEQVKYSDGVNIVMLQPRGYYHDDDLLGLQMTVIDRSNCNRNGIYSKVMKRVMLKQIQHRDDAKGIAALWSFDIDKFRTKYEELKALAKTYKERFETKQSNQRTAHARADAMRKKLNLDYSNDVKYDVASGKYSFVHKFENLSEEEVARVLAILKGEAWKLNSKPSEKPYTRADALDETEGA